MANYSVLKAAVQAVVKTNGNQEITGANMQSTLISIINSLGTGYQFMGVATPSTSPGTPDYNVAYIGGAGTYANFGTSITIPVGSICVFKYNGSWAKEQIALFAGIDDAPTINSNNLVKSGGVYDGLLNTKYELTISDAKEVGYLKSDGTIENNYNYGTTDYINVYGLSKIELCLSQTQSNIYVWFYDGEKTQISGTNEYRSLVAAVIAIPQNAIYMRASFRTATLTGQYIKGPEYMFRTITNNNISINAQYILGNKLYASELWDYAINIGYMSDSNGNITYNTDYRVTDYIPTAQGVTIVNLFNYNSTAFIAFYDKDKQLLLATNAFTSNAAAEIIAPSNTYFMRITLHRLHLDGKYIQYVGTLVQRIDTIEANIYEPSERVFYDQDVDGFQGKYIGSDGDLVANVNWNTSSYTKTEYNDKLEVYLFNVNTETVFVAFYDSAFSCVQTNFVPSWQKTILTVPSTASYFRFSCEQRHLGGYVKLIKKSVLSPYINDLKVYTVCNDISGVSNPSRNYSAKVYIDHLFRKIANHPAIQTEDGLNYVPVYSKYEIDYTTSYINSNVNNTSNNVNVENQTIQLKGDCNDTFSLHHISTLNSITANKPVRLLCIGDSVTAGSNAQMNRPYANAPRAYWEWVQALFEMDKIENNNSGYHCVTLGNLIRKPKDDGTGWEAYTKRIFDINFNGITENDVMACCCAFAGTKIEQWNQQTIAGSTENPFWDSTNNKFSLSKWIQRYRTLVVNQDGTTTRCDESNKGSDVTDVNAYNVCEPTHVLLAFGYNESYEAEGTVRTSFLDTIASIVSAIHSEYPNIYILVQLPDTAGTYFPNLFPQYVGEGNDIYGLDFTKGDAKTYHDRFVYMTSDLMNLESAANKIYYVPSFFVSPLCKGAGYRSTEDIIRLSTDSVNDDYRVESGTNGPYLHPNNVAHASWAYQIYSLIKYTLTL